MKQQVQVCMYFISVCKFFTCCYAHVNEFIVFTLPSVVCNMYRLTLGSKVIRDIYPRNHGFAFCSQGNSNHITGLFYVTRLATTIVPGDYSCQCVGSCISLSVACFLAPYSLGVVCCHNKQLLLSLFRSLCLFVSLPCAGPLLLCRLLSLCCFFLFLTHSIVKTHTLSDVSLHRTQCCTFFSLLLMVVVVC